MGKFGFPGENPHIPRYIVNGTPLSKNNVFYPGLIAPAPKGVSRNAANQHAWADRLAWIPGHCQNGSEIMNDYPKLSSPALLKTFELVAEISDKIIKQMMVKP